MLPENTVIINFVLLYDKTNQKSRSPLFSQLSKGFTSSSTYHFLISFRINQSLVIFRQSWLFCYMCSVFILPIMTSPHYVTVNESTNQMRFSKMMEISTRYFFSSRSILKKKLTGQYI